MDNCCCRARQRLGGKRKKTKTEKKKNPSNPLRRTLDNELCCCSINRREGGEGVCSNFISAALKSELNNWPNRFHYVSLIVSLCVKRAATIDGRWRWRGSWEGVESPEPPDNYDVTSCHSAHPPTPPVSRSFFCLLAFITGLRRAGCCTPPHFFFFSFVVLQRLINAAVIAGDPAGPPQIKPGGLHQGRW